MICLNYATSLAQSLKDKLRRSQTSLPSMREFFEECRLLTSLSQLLMNVIPDLWTLKEAKTYNFDDDNDVVIIIVHHQKSNPPKKGWLVILLHSLLNGWGWWDLYCAALLTQRMIREELKTIFIYWGTFPKWWTPLPPFGNLMFKKD